MLNIESPGKTANFILRFVSAVNERELERQMLKVQTRLKGAVRWRTPFINPVNKKWYAYYEIDILVDEQSIKTQTAKDNQ